MARAEIGRRLLLAGVAAAALGLAGCGYEPLYGKFPSRGGVAPSDELAAVAIDPVQLRLVARERFVTSATGSDRVAQLVRNHLQDFISPSGKPAKPRYRLAISIDEYRAGSVIGTADNATRIVVNMYATYRLFDLDDGGKQIRDKQLRAFSAYNVLAADYGNVSAERDARERLALELAENIRNDLGVWFSRQRVAGPS